MEDYLAILELIKNMFLGLYNAFDSIIIFGSFSLMQFAIASMLIYISIGFISWWLFPHSADSGTSTVIVKKKKR